MVNDARQVTALTFYSKAGAAKFDLIMLLKNSIFTNLTSYIYASLALQITSNVHVFNGQKVLEDYSYSPHTVCICFNKKG